MITRKHLWLLPFLLAAACNDQGGAPPGGTNPPPDDKRDWRAIVHDADEPLQHRINAAFDGIEQDTCFRDADNVSTCDWNTYAADPAHVDPAFLPREAILITDILRPAVEMLRYRNRVLGFYEVLDDGSIAAMPIEWELPETFGAIITGFASSPAVPSSDLGVLQQRLQEVYGDSVPSFSTHGLAVFNVLADLVPENPIVFLDINRLTFHQSVPEVVCSIGAEEDQVDVRMLREHSERFAQNLQSLFVTHNIRFVNASWGYTIETIRGPWKNVCGTEAPPDDVLLAILEAYRPIFDALFNTEGVFTAHAAFASPIDAHYPFDQPLAEFPNRLRVGVFQHPGAEVPVDGLHEIPPTWSPQPGAGDADVWVNTGCSYDAGCRSGHALGLTVQYGMGRTDFPLAQTSFINPVLLGAFVHFRNQTHAAPMSDTLIRQIIDRLTAECATDAPSRCRYIDPLLHEHTDGS